MGSDIFNSGYFSRGDRVFRGRAMVDLDLARRLPFPCNCMHCRRGFRMKKKARLTGKTYACYRTDAFIGG
jgi:hypothetical protein